MSPSTSERYLVTGAAGFIGARVAEMLLEAGHAVDGLDSVNDAYDARLKHWRLDRLRARTGFSFQQLDLAERGAAEQYVAARPRGVYRAVLHLAARAGVRASVADPWAYYRDNCDATLNVLEACRRHGIAKFVLASTSSLYGLNNPRPFREDADTNRPLSPYAASKKAAETLAHSYHYLHGLDVSVLRYFTVYGPAGRPDMSVFRFVRNICEGAPIAVLGDGRQERDFTYIDDIARGTIAAARPLGYEVINLGGDRPVKLCDVIERIASLAGRTAVIERRPADPVDVPATWADISKARRLLDFSPQVPLEEGLARAVQWHRENRDLARQIRLE